MIYRWSSNTFLIACDGYSIFLLLFFEFGSIPSPLSAIFSFLPLSSPLARDHIRTPVDRYIRTALAGSSRREMPASYEMMARLFGHEQSQLRAERDFLNHKCETAELSRPGRYSSKVRGSFHMKGSITVRFAAIRFYTLSPHCDTCARALVLSLLLTSGV